MPVEYNGGMQELFLAGGMPGSGSFWLGWGSEAQIKRSTLLAGKGS
jgi:hypothetical protein